MTKKKKNVKIDTVPSDLVEWSEGQTHIGTPTMVLLPPKKYHFKVSNSEHKITIPRKGNYHEIAPGVFPEEEGNFMLYDEENEVMYLPAITKVLFAVNKYPDLASNQLFAPIALVFDEDTVDIIGQIVEIIPVSPPK